MPDPTGQPPSATACETHRKNSETKSSMLALLLNALSNNLVCFKPGSDLLGIQIRYRPRNTTFESCPCASGTSLRLATEKAPAFSFVIVRWGMAASYAHVIKM